jgi:hypothetical protein
MDEAFSAQGMVLLAAGPRDPEFAKSPVGEQFSLGGQSVAAMVFRTGRATRMVNYENASGSIAARFRDLGMRTAVGPPIIVEGPSVGRSHRRLDAPGRDPGPDPIAQPALPDRESAIT